MCSGPGPRTMRSIGATEAPPGQEDHVTVIVDSPLTQSSDSYPISDRARWFAAALFVLGGALQLTEFLLEPAFGSSAQRVQWWLTHSSQLQLSQTAGLLAIPCLVGSFWFGYRLVRRQSPRLAAVAVSMLLCAMVGLAGVHGVEMSAHWAAQQGHAEAAVGILDVDNPGIPGMALFVMFLPTAILGNIVMAVAMWRSHYVPRLVVLFVIAFTLLDFAAGQGVASHASDLVTGALLAWAVLARYVRSPRRARSSRAD